MERHDIGYDDSRYDPSYDLHRVHNRATRSNSTLKLIFMVGGKLRLKIR